MKPQNTAAPVAKKPSTGSSKAGAILSILALIISAIGYSLANAHYRSKTPVNGAGERAGELITQGASRGLAVILSMPLLIAGIGLAALAIIFIVIRLPKVKAMGIITSILWGAISIWAFKVAIAGFHLIKG